MPKNFCQNPLCHLEDTKDRIKKGVYQTRKSNSGFWNYFCTQRCFHQYFNIFKNRIIEHIGLTTTPNTRPLDSENYWARAREIHQNRDHDYYNRDADVLIYERLNQN